MKKAEPSGPSEPQRSRERIEAQAEKTFSPLPPEEDQSQEWTERWGRRLGRIIGYGLALYLLWHLLTRYMFPA